MHPHIDTVNTPTMRDKILQLIEGRDSKTFTRLITSRPEIAQYVAEHTKQWDTQNINETVYCIVNQITPPQCPCGGKALFNSYVKGYRKFCNYRCPKKGEAHSTTMTDIWEEDTDRKQRVTKAVQETMLERYGARNAMHVPEILDRVKQTNLQRYGVELPFQSAEIRQRAAHSLMESHGVLTPFESAAIRQQAAATFEQNHGAPNRMQIARAAYHEKHGVENTFQVSEVKEKIRETLVERYGVDHALQSPQFMAKQKATVQTRYGVTNVAQINWGDLTKKFMQDPTIFTSELETHSIQELALKYEIASGTIYRRAQDLGLRPSSSVATSRFEEDVAAFIAQHYSDPILRHNRSVITPQELDIYLPNLNFGIECNGTWWHSELGGKKQHYHRQKTDSALQAGVTLFHVWEHDWISRRPIIESMLLSRLRKSHSIAARQCTIQQLDTATARQFYEANHIQGWAPSTVHLGLYHDSRLVMAISLAKPRYSHQYQWELIRMASLCGHTVTGGASRLLTEFRRQYNPTSIVSYSDRSYATGKVYQQLGFVYMHTSAPNYWYTHDHQQFYHRSRFQKHKLAEALPVFDPQLTEWQNMQANGWNRIWDCGNDVWVLRFEHQ